MFDLLLIRDLVTNPVLVGKDGKLFTCHKFRSMTVPVRQAQGSASWSSVSVARDSRITPFGATLRHYKLDELQERIIAEYIWNGFDACATTVKVAISTEADFQGVTDIMIEDNGKGIVYEELSIAFKRFYESRKSLEDNIGTRFSRGKNGYGRFTFFKLCRKAKWETTYQKTYGVYSYDI